MKLGKKLIAFAVFALLTMAVTVTAFAATATTHPSQIVAELTGRSVEEVVAECRDGGKTYGAIAQEAGKLEAFQAEMLKVKTTRLQQQVNNGSITQQEADEIIAAVQEAQANCNGTGTGQCGVGRNSGGQCGAGRGNNGAGCGGRGACFA